MYSFLVLGLVPGTSIQITFQTWFDAIGIIIIIAALAFLGHLHGRHANPLSKLQRSILPASQLHCRVQ